MNSGRETGVYTEDLINPILTCLSDSDHRVRYYACESLYNVVKVARDNVLPMFTDIFSAISVVVADPDQNVKNGSELLDRLLKDIVTESKKFEVASFVSVLKKRKLKDNPGSVFRTVFLTRRSWRISQRSRTTDHDPG